MTNTELLGTSRENVFTRCVENANEAIMITDARGTLLFVNSAWIEIYGYSEQEAIGNSPRMLRSPYQGSDFYAEMWQQITNPSIGFWKGELINLSKDGKEVPVLLSITPYKDDKNQVRGYMGIALNLSEKKKMEAQILQQDRLASIGLLASGLAHEIGTPLGVIRGRAEYLQMSSGGNEIIRSGLEVIVTQIDRISKLIYSLLHLARAEKSEISRPISVKESIDSVFTLADQKMRSLRINYSHNLSDRVVVKAESDKLTQVFLNLIMNAIHAIESRQKNEPGCPANIHVQALDRNTNWEIAITDSGCGISKENFANLFKPFFTTKDIGTGTGLGLAITLQIIESWNGKVHVRSELNQGTTFFLTLQKA